MSERTIEEIRAELAIATERYVAHNGGMSTGEALRSTVLRLSEELGHRLEEAPNEE